MFLEFIVWIPVSACVSTKLLHSVGSPPYPAPLGPWHPHQVLHWHLLQVCPQRQVLQRDVLDHCRSSLSVGGLAVVEQGGDVHLGCLHHLLHCQASRIKLSCKFDPNNTMSLRWGVELKVVFIFMTCSLQMICLIFLCKTTQRWSMNSQGHLYICRFSSLVQCSIIILNLMWTFVLHFGESV